MHDNTGENKIIENKNNVDNKSIISEEEDIDYQDNLFVEKEYNSNILQNAKILEKINENDEDNYSTNRETVKELLDSFQQDPEELISNLLQKITKLEDQVNYLQQKNGELTKDNIQNDTKLQKMSYIGTRKKFMLGNKSDNKIDIAELLKEKNDLQEINENMLNMLTDKELENEELQKNFENYKNEMKLQIQKYLKTIDELEEKISDNNQNKENYDDNIDYIVPPI